MLCNVEMSFIFYKFQFYIFKKQRTYDFGNRLHSPLHNLKNCYPKLVAYNIIKIQKALRLVVTNISIYFIKKSLIIIYYYILYILIKDVKY